jgi:hypothetical protein
MDKSGENYFSLAVDETVHRMSVVRRQIFAVQVEPYIFVLHLTLLFETAFPAAIVLPRARATNGGIDNCAK